MYLSNDTFINTLYMTIITITTVGFGEVYLLSQEERLFTVFLILMSAITVRYVASVLTEYTRDLDLRRKTGCSVIGFKTQDCEYVINSNADSKLIVLGSSKQIQNLNKLF